MKPAAIRMVLGSLCLAAGIAGGWLVRRNTERSPDAAAKPSPRPAPPPPGLGSRNGTKIADAPLKEEPTKSMVPVTRASDFRLAARIAALSPEQARRHLAAGFAARNVWLAELLWCRAASDDPAGMLEQRTVPGVNPESGEASEPTEPLRGIFRAWVRRDAAAALEAARSTPQRQEIFIQEWTAHDPAAAARAVERGEIPIKHLARIVQAWSTRAPDAALAWVNSIRDAHLMDAPWRSSSATYAPSQAGNDLAEWQGKMRADLLQARVATDPAGALPGILALEWGRPWTSDDGPSNALDDHIRIAFDTVAALSPEFAAQFAADLSQERLTPPLARNITRALESARPGTGLAWAQTLTDPALRDPVLAGLGAPDSRARDFASAVSILEGLSPATRGRVAWGIVQRWVQLDPGAVHEWLTGPLPEMPAPDAAALRKVFNEHVARRLPKLVLPSQ